MNKNTKQIEYLTEDGLYTMLVNRYGSDNIVRQFRLQNRTRVDFTINDNGNKIAVEFDGYQHYQKMKVIDRDIENQFLLKDLGYHIIHIPYFVQAEFVFPFYFHEMDIKKFTRNSSKYPNGFIDKDCIRPIDFSVYGWNRFIYEVSHYPTPIREDIRFTMSDQENDIYESIFRSDWVDKELYDDAMWMVNCMWG